MYDFSQSLGQKEKKKAKKDLLLEPQKLGFLSRISQNSKKIPKEFQKNSAFGQKIQKWAQKAQNWH